eukprot:jgi/Undpi1/3888/HiC_scaffold_16.g07256.m1
MGAASSVRVDPTALRKEYEAKAASAASDEEILKHMKTLIIKAGKAFSVSTRLVVDGAGDNGGNTKVTGMKTQNPDGSGRRGSALRPNSHEGRIAFGSSKQGSPRRGSWSRRQSKEEGRPISAPGESPAASKGPARWPRSPIGGKNENNPRKCRRRSYLAEKINVVVKESGGVPAAGGAEAVAASQGDEAEEPNVDSWESVSLQPSCPTCHTAFPSEEQRDECIKTCAARGDQAAGSTADETASSANKAVDSTTIYSGTKLFWRSRLTVELLMQQHQQVNAVQVLVFDSSTDQQLGQLWVAREEVVARIGEDALKAETKAAEAAFRNLGVNATPENVAAEATKRAVVSFIIKRILVEDITEDGADPEAPKAYKVTLTQMASDDGVQLAMEQPKEVNPAVNRATTKRASIQEVDSVVKNLKENLSDVQGSAQAAVVNLECAEGAMEKGRRGSVEVARRASASGM